MQFPDFIPISTWGCAPEGKPADAEAGYPADDLSFSMVDIIRLPAYAVP